jgi:hypothetical protein
MTVKPELATVVAARVVKLAAVPSGIVRSAADADAALTPNAPIARTASTPPVRLMMALSIAPDRRSPVEPREYPRISSRPH